jgi:anaerobic dimethyl sulfoxide reductase subunit B (iron-sulfur subunit)
MAQYGFLIDLSRCIGCNACVIGCKQWHDVAPGPEKWMRVYQWEKGAFPQIDLRVLPIPCFHCEIPVCAEACPNKAIYKEEKWGAVLVDPEKCTGTRNCFEACPYGSPQFAGDETGLKMSKCNMCVDRLVDGLAPLCVLSCSMRALEFGPIDELMKKYGEKRQTEAMPRKDFAPCRIACPAGLKAESYIKLISENKFEEA